MAKALPEHSSADHLDKDTDAHMEIGWVPTDEEDKMLTITSEQVRAHI